MRTAMIRTLGEPPESTEIAESDHDGQSVTVDVQAVALNPVDIAIGTGRFYAGHPPVPFVVGLEAVGRTRDGRSVYVQGAGRGIATDGLAAERVQVPPEILIEIPAAADPKAAVALGTAGLAGWLSVTWRAAVGSADRVVVLGASGSVGNVAIQAAQRSGAASVVGVARDPSRVDALQDEPAAVVALGGDFASLADAVTEAAGGAPTVVIDMLWGQALSTLLPTLAQGARIVQVGASADPEATITSAAVRGRQLEILGYSNFAVPRETLVDAYQQLVALHIEGAIDVPFSEFPLERVAEAWSVAAAGSAKAVLTIEDVK